MKLPLQSDRSKTNLLVLLKELAKGYYTILLIGAICVLALIASMLLA